MEEFKNFIDALEATRLLAISQALILLLSGYLGGKIISGVIAKLFQKKMTVHGQLLLKRGIFYSFFTLLAISALQHLGFDLNVLLGAAGILTVAVGFASQTSA